jgi:hypothetical protein
LKRSISVVKASRDGLVFRCLVGLPLDKGSGSAANHNEIENQQFYLKFRASNETLELFIDSAGGQNRGFGIYFQRKWTQKCWSKDNKFFVWQPQFHR